MNLEQLRAEHSDLVTAIEAAAREGMIPSAELQQQLGTAKAEGAASERARILAIEAQAIPGHEPLVAKLKADGVSVADAAQQILAAEKGARIANLAAIEGDAGTIIPAVEGGGPSVDANAPIEDRTKAQWDKDPAIRSEFGKYESFLAYSKKAEAGGVRILGKK